MSSVPKGASEGRVARMTGCGYAECFVPDSRHNECAAAGLTPTCWGRLEHQHAIRRSQGGKRCDVMLCSAHHSQIDSGHRYEGLRLSNRISHWDGDSGPRWKYVIEDRDTGEVLLEIPIGGDE